MGSYLLIHACWKSQAKVKCVFYQVLCWVSSIYCLKFTVIQIDKWRRVRKWDKYWHQMWCSKRCQGQTGSLTAWLQTLVECQPSNGRPIWLTKSPLTSHRVEHSGNLSPSLWYLSSAVNNWSIHPSPFIPNWSDCTSRTVVPPESCRMDETSVLIILVEDESTVCDSRYH